MRSDRFLELRKALDQRERPFRGSKVFDRRRAEHVLSIRNVLRDARLRADDGAGADRQMSRKTRLTCDRRVVPQHT